jgi:hypothetical protein
MVDKSPAEDKLLQREVRVWEPKEHRPTLTWSRSGYKPYSTYVELYILVFGVLTRLQGQEQVLCMDADRQGTRIEVRFLLLALYISGTNQRSNFTLAAYSDIYLRRNLRLQSSSDSFKALPRMCIRCDSRRLISNLWGSFCCHRVIR